MVMQQPGFNTFTPTPFDPMQGFATPAMQAPAMAFGSNPFNLQNLEGTDIGRRAIFEQARPDFLRTSFQRDVFSNLFNRAVNDFLGELGTSFALGEAPQRSFTDFINAQDFGRQVRREGRTSGDGGLRSTARFLFQR